MRGSGANRLAWALTSRPGLERTPSTCCSGKFAHVREPNKPDTYSKLLTRNTFVKPAQEGDDEKKAPTSSADILNLISIDVEATAELVFTFLGIFRNLIEMLVGASYVWILLGASSYFRLPADD